MKSNSLLNTVQSQTSFTKDVYILYIYTKNVFGQEVYLDTTKEHWKSIRNSYIQIFFEFNVYFG